MTEQQLGDDDGVGTRIRAARERNEMTVAMLARRLGVESRTVSAWESGRRIPRSNRLLMLAGVLDVNLLWLLDGRDDVSRTLIDTDMDDLRHELESMSRTVAQLSSTIKAARRKLDVLSDQQ